MKRLPAPSAHDLDRDIGTFIARGFEDPPTHAEFNSLALRLFDYQFQNNKPYHEFCHARDIAPEGILSWKEIPAVPVSAFKVADLACEPLARARRIFHTSGTTRGSERRGRHFLFNLALYDLAAGPNFKRYVLPDHESLPMFILAAHPSHAPDSSLAYMLERVRESFGSASSRYVMDSNGLQANLLLDCIQHAGDLPVCLLGTSYAYIHFMDRLRESNTRLRLPEGSRIMDTGGYKGKSRDLTRDEFLAEIENTLGVPPAFVVNEYGMTELTSQFYDNLLFDYTRGMASSRCKTIPPWVRVRVVSPDTLEEAPDGERGLLAIYDLGNRGSVLAIQTEDIGVRIGDGFEVEGRATGAEARGCSLAAAEFLHATRG
ncbi:MAG: long-chain fatty acid--CoA ligase [bacterium]